MPTARSTLKQYFRQYATPTEGQFAELIDSFLHKTEDSILISQISGLQQQLDKMVTQEDIDRDDEQLRADIQALQNLLAQIRSRLTAAEDDIDTAEDNIAGHETRIRTLESTKADASALASYALKTTTDGHETRIATLETTKADASALANYALKTTTDGHETRIATLETDKADASALANYALKTTTDGHETRISTLESQRVSDIDKLNASIAHVQFDIENLSALRQVADLDQYDAQDGDIVQYIGPTTAEYVNGYVYKLAKKEFESTDKILVVDAPYTNVKEGFDAAALINDKYFIKGEDGSMYFGTEPLYNESYLLIVGEKGYPAVGDTVIGQYNTDTKMQPCYEVTEVVSSTYPFVVKFIKNDYPRTLTIDRQVSNYRFYNSDGICISLLGSWTDDYYDNGRTMYDVYHSVEVLYNDKAYEVAVGDINCALGENVNVHEWKQHDTQPSSASDVSDLQSRMTTAEGNITANAGAITAHASRLTSLEAASHTRNADTQIIHDASHKAVVSGSGLSVTGDAAVSGSLSISGNLNVSGKETVTEIQHVTSENDSITLRHGAQVPVSSISGIKAENYDGLGNNLVFGTDSGGTFRIGDEHGTLEPLCTRDEAANLADGDPAVWDAANLRIKTADNSVIVGGAMSASSYFMSEEAYWDAYAANTIANNKVYSTYYD